MATRRKNWNDPHYQDTLVAHVMQGEFEKNIYTAVYCNAIPGTIYEKHIYPVEMSIVAFSLARGIHDCVTVMIDPGRPERGGVAFSAKVLAEDTGLPQPGSKFFTAAHRDYKAIAAKIINIIDQYMCLQEEEYPRRIVFGMNTNADMLEMMGSFQWLSNNCKEPDLSARLKALEFGDLSKLFYRLAKFVNHRNKNYMSPMIQFQLPNLGEAQLNKFVPFQYSTQISCLYHQQEASDKLDKCAKNYILRRVFIILGELVGALGIEPCSGHLFSWETTSGSKSRTESK